MLQRRASDKAEALLQVLWFQVQGFLSTVSGFGGLLLVSGWGKAMGSDFYSLRKQTVYQKTFNQHAPANS